MDPSYLTEVSDSISHRIGQGDSKMKKVDALTETF